MANIVKFGTKVLVAEGSKIKKGQKVAEWDPFTIPVISEKALYPLAKRCIMCVLFGGMPELFTQVLRRFLCCM